MTFDVTDGRIPDRVVTWLRDRFGLVAEGSDGIGTLWTGGVLYGTPWLFPWPHTRQPTLGEALEAVAQR